MKEIWVQARLLQGEKKDAYLLNILNTYGDSKGVVQRVLHEADRNSKAAEAAMDALADFKQKDPQYLFDNLGTDTKYQSASDKLP